LPAEHGVAELWRDAAWYDDILGLLEEDEPESDLTKLARVLAARGKRAPVFGHELGERRWQVDFGWPSLDPNVGVLAQRGDDEEARKRDEAYASAGWTVRTATEWLDHLESLLGLLPDATPDLEGSAHR
jgi:hypothetical protein